MYQPITLSFYDGFDGPTIRIDTDSLNDIRQIQKIFQRLGNNEIEAFDFLSLPDIIVDNVAAFTLRLVKTEHSKTTRQVASNHIEWSRDTEGWQDSASLLGGILGNRRPGHQYVSAGVKDDVLIVVAYGES